MGIKNGDLPAMPLTGDAYTDLSGYIHKSYSYNPECLGMTKRETMEMHFMAALLSDSKMNGQFSDFAKLAVKAADALLAEQERTK